MKHLVLITLLILLSSIGRTQNVDSMITAPQTIELTISTPQPRLSETFKISLDINHLKATIFKSLAGKVRLSDDITTAANDEISINVSAVKKGINEIGPLEFYLDKTKYTTSKLTFEVIDDLPNTDKGLWFRKVMTSDTSFCLIIEQRIPANSKINRNSDNSITFTTEPESNDILKFADDFTIEGLKRGNSRTATNFSSVTINGEEREFLSGYSVYFFTIEDRKAKIKITKDKFQYIPDDHIFKEIVVQ